MHNDIFAIASFAENEPTHMETNLLLARYFFSQFWCEFTKEVVTEFLNEDLIIKELQAEKRTRLVHTNTDQSLQPDSSNHFRIRPHNDGIAKNLPSNIEDSLREEIFANYSAR